MDGNDHFDLDAYKPANMARMAEQSGVAKANMVLPQLFVLGTLAGAFIAFGALFYLLTVTDSGLGYGPTRLLGGVAFSLGLILVVVAGAELFTGNNLIVLAYAHGQIPMLAMLRNWGVVYVANLVGSLIMVVAALASGILDGAMGETAVAVAKGKAGLSPFEALVRGILCNTLVCLAVWLSYAARRVSGKVLAIVFPIAAFVALGFEHSVANMFLMPLGLILADMPVLAPTIANLVPVTIGNIIGGAGFVAATYWFCYLKDR
ncbi:MAG: formate/nitrite transporter family protein [Alphaproteobacteria bacterium]|jgi:formate/nitrite transporter|nr:formate/nitrite transporter family protein [Alphaproteobacteria bacterium]